MRICSLKVTCITSLPKPKEKLRKRANAIARRDMVDIAKYIGIKFANPDAADRLAEEMIESAESLTDMPYKCPAYIPVKPLKHEYRKLIVHNYIMFYWINEDEKLVTIARVVYSRQDYEKLL